MRIRWEILIVLIATFNGFVLPYQVAFLTHYGSFDYYDIIDIVIDIIFWIDILINFRTTYLDTKSSEEIMDAKMIALKYVRGRFWIDLLSVLPVNYLEYIIPDASTSTLQFLGLLKLVRIVRFGKLITFLNLMHEIKNTLKIVKLVFYLVIFCHVIS